MLTPLSLRLRIALFALFACLTLTSSPALAAQGISAAKYNRALELMDKVNVQGGTDNARAFFQAMSAEGLNMRDLMAFKEAWTAKTAQSLEKTRGGPKALDAVSAGMAAWESKYGACERYLMDSRRTLVIQAFDAGIMRLVGDNTSFPYIIRMDVGAFATEGRDKLSFAGDIDMTVVAPLSSQSVRLRDYINQEIKRTFGQDMAGMDSNITAHRKPLLEVYVTSAAADWAEIDALKRGVIQEVLIDKGKIRYEPVNDALDKAFIFANAKNNEGLARGRPDQLASLMDDAIRGMKTSNLRPGPNMDPAVSLELLRHMQTDAVDASLSVPEKLLKLAKYVQRSLEIGGAPKDGDFAALANWAREITAIRRGQGNNAEKLNRVLLASRDILGRPKTLDAVNSAVARLGGDAVNLLRLNVVKGIQNRKVHIANEDRRSRQDGDNARQNLMDELSQIADAYEKVKVNFPDEAKQTMIELMESLKNRQAPIRMEDVEKVKKFIDEFAQKPGGAKLALSAGWQYLVSAYGTTEKALEGMNWVLDVLDNNSLGVIREMNFNIKVGGKGDKFSFEVPLDIGSMNKWLNDTYLGKIGNSAPVKAFNLYQEGLAYWNAWNNAKDTDEARHLLALELCRRRLPGGAMVENYMNENYLLAGYNLVTMIFPPLGLPEALYGMSMHFAEVYHGYRVQWDYDAMVDLLYDHAVFEKGPDGRYSLFQVSYPNPKTGRMVIVSKHELHTLPDKDADVARLLRFKVEETPIIAMYHTQLEHKGISDGKINNDAWPCEFAGLTRPGQRMYRDYSREAAKITREYFAQVLEELEKRANFQSGFGADELRRVCRELGEPEEALVKLIGDNRAELEEVLEAYEQWTGYHRDVKAFVERWSAWYMGSLTPRCMPASIKNARDFSKKVSEEAEKGRREATVDVEAIVGEEAADHATLMPAVRARAGYYYFASHNKERTQKIKEYNEYLESLRQKKAKPLGLTIYGPDEAVAGWLTNYSVILDRAASQVEYEWELIARPHDDPPLNEKEAKKATLGYIPYGPGDKELRVRARLASQGKEREDKSWVTASKRIKVIAHQDELLPELRLSCPVTSFSVGEQVPFTAHLVRQGFNEVGFKKYTWFINNEYWCDTEENVLVFDGVKKGEMGANDVNYSGKTVEVRVVGHVDLPGHRFSRSSVTVQCQEWHVDADFTTVRVDMEPKPAELSATARSLVFKAVAIGRGEGGKFTYEWKANGAEAGKGKDMIFAPENFAGKDVRIELRVVQHAPDGRIKAQGAASHTLRVLPPGQEPGGGQKEGKDKESGGGQEEGKDKESGGAGDEGGGFGPDGQAGKDDGQSGGGLKEGEKAGDSGNREDGKESGVDAGSDGQEGKEDTQRGGGAQDGGGSQAGGGKGRDDPQKGGGQAGEGRGGTQSSDSGQGAAGDAQSQGGAGQGVSGQSGPGVVQGKPDGQGAAGQEPPDDGKGAVQGGPQGGASGAADSGETEIVIGGDESFEEDLLIPNDRCEGARETGKSETAGAKEGHTPNSASNVTVSPLAESWDSWDATKNTDALFSIRRISPSRIPAEGGKLTVATSLSGCRLAGAQVQFRILVRERKKSSGLEKDRIEERWAALGDSTTISPVPIGSIEILAILWDTRKNRKLSDLKLSMFTREEAKAQGERFTEADAPESGPEYTLTLKQSSGSSRVAMGETVSFVAALKDSGQAKDGKAKPKPVFYFEPHPEVSFSPQNGTGISTRARFSEPGPVEVWATAEVDGKTVAESNRIPIEVTGPDLSFTVSPKEPRIGQEVKVILNAKPKLADGAFAVWDISGGKHRRAGSLAADSTSYSFVPDEAKTYVIKAETRSYKGHTSGESTVSIPVSAWKLVIDNLGVHGPRPQEWVQGVGLKEIAKDSFMVDEQVRLRAKVTDKGAPEDLRWKWRLGPNTSTRADSISKDITVYGTKPGKAAIEVEARNNENVVLGTASASFPVVAKPEAPTPKASDFKLRLAQSLWTGDSVPASLELTKPFTLKDYKYTWHCNYKITPKGVSAQIGPVNGLEPVEVRVQVSDKSGKKMLAEVKGRAQVKPVTLTIQPGDAKPRGEIVHPDGRIAPPAGGAYIIGQVLGLSAKTGRPVGAAEYAWTIEGPGRLSNKAVRGGNSLEMTGLGPVKVRCAMLIDGKEAAVAGLEVTVGATQDMVKAADAYRQALQSYQRQKYDLCLQSIRLAQSLDPENAFLKKEEERFLATQKQQQAEILWKEAANLERLKQYQEAMAKYREGLVLYESADIRKKIANIEKTLAQMEEKRQKDCAEAEKLRNMAAAKGEADKLSQALEDYRKADKLCPSPETETLVADIQKRIDKQRADCARAASLENAARRFKNQKQYETALQGAEDASRLCPTNERYSLVAELRTLLERQKKDAENITVQTQQTTAPTGGSGSSGSSSVSSGVQTGQGLSGGGQKDQTGGSGQPVDKSADVTKKGGPTGTGGQTGGHVSPGSSGKGSTAPGGTGSTADFSGALSGQDTTSGSQKTDQIGGAGPGLSGSSGSSSGSRHPVDISGEYDMTGESGGITRTFPDPITIEQGGGAVSAYFSGDPKEERMSGSYDPASGRLFISASIGRRALEIDVVCEIRGSALVCVGSGTVKTTGGQANIRSLTLTRRGGAPQQPPDKKSGQAQQNQPLGEYGGAPMGQLVPGLGGNSCDEIGEHMVAGQELAKLGKFPEALVYYRQALALCEKPELRNAVEKLEQLVLLNKRAEDLVKKAEQAEAEAKLAEAEAERAEAEAEQAKLDEHIAKQNAEEDRKKKEQAKKQTDKQIDKRTTKQSTSSSLPADLSGQYVMVVNLQGNSFREKIEIRQQGASIVVRALSKPLQYSGTYNAASGKAQLQETSPGATHPLWSVDLSCTAGKRGFSCTGPARVKAKGAMRQIGTVTLEGDRTSSPGK